MPSAKALPVPAGSGSHARRRRESTRSSAGRARPGCRAGAAGAEAVPPRPPRAARRPSSGWGSSATSRCWAALWPLARPPHYVKTEEKNFGKGRLAMVERYPPCPARAQWPASSQSGCGRIRAPPWRRDALPRLCSSGVARARALAPWHLRLCAFCYHERVRTRPELEEGHKKQRKEMPRHLHVPGHVFMSPVMGSIALVSCPVDLYSLACLRCCACLHSLAVAAAAVAAACGSSGSSSISSSSGGDWTAPCRGGHFLFLRLPRGGLAPTPHGSDPLECSFY